MSNGRALRRKIKGVRGVSRRKRRRVGGVLPKHELDEMLKPLREAFGSVNQETDLETEGERSDE